LLIVWGGIALYDYVRSSDGLVDLNELKEAQKILDEQSKPKRKYTKKAK
jgi:hypothetical protein